MEDDVLTFSELRKIQKEEKRQDKLTDLEDNFLLRVGDYLETKKAGSQDSREYRNAKRVFDKIMGIRQEKIVKNARISVKSGVKASQLNLLPREKELFLDLKEVFQGYTGKVNDLVEEGKDNFEEVEIPEEEESEDEEDEVGESQSAEEGYVVVKIISDVPEFMGTDLESYGPFDEGEEVEIPEDNAEILVNRGNAEELD
ncbi:MAG: hypothetical protein ABEJ72_03880 [Candidatus Aenigmatarchaeota archaeon]